MGRRTLPKIDRSIPIDGHFDEMADLSPPWDPDTYFGRAGPLEIEIGSGKGLFLLNRSARHPDRRYLGIEISKKYARFSAYRIAKGDRENVRIIRGDAMVWMRDFMPGDSADAVHVYFPDPWWKERHRRRRVINPFTMRDIERVLRPGGEFHFWTDVEEYYESACQIIQSSTDLRGPMEVPERPAENDMDYRTHFERRMRLNDHPVFRSRFRFDCGQD